MIFDFDTRPSDSPFVETIYRTRSIGGGSFTSIATTQWEMVITKQKGKIILSLRSQTPAQIAKSTNSNDVVFIQDEVSLQAYDQVNT
jgi:hypothetical protein